MNRFEYDLTVSSCTDLTIQNTQGDLNEEWVNECVREKEIETEGKQDYIYCDVTFTFGLFATVWG